MLISDLIAVLIIAVLSGMGIGSGGLLVLYLTAIRDVPQLHAQGINLLFFIFASGAALCIHISRRRIPFFTVLLLVAAGLCASPVGTHLAHTLPEDTVSRLFGLFLVCAGTYTLLQGKKTKKIIRKK